MARFGTFKKLFHERKSFTGYHTWIAEQPRAKLLICHDFAVYGGRYRHLAEHLCRQGISVFALDFQGHGFASGRRGCISDAQAWLRDADLCMQNMVQEHAIDRLHVFGHGVGSLVSLHIAENFGDLVSQLILTNPILGFYSQIPNVLRKINDYIGHRATGIPVLNWDPKLIFQSKAAQQSYEKDERIFHGFISHQTLKEFEIMAQEVHSRLEEVHCPTTVFVGNGDRLVKRAAIEQWLEMLGSQKHQLISVEKGRHELFNPLERLDLIPELLNLTITAHQVQPAPINP